MSLDQQIEDQRVVVAQVERRLVERGVSAVMTPGQMAGARSSVTEERTYLDGLLARKSNRDVVVATHEAAVREHADDLVMLANELEGARRELGAVVTAAIQALGAAWVAAEQFDALLADRAAQLREMGIPAVYMEHSDDEVRFDVGGYERTTATRPHLLVAGQSWERVYPRQVVGYAHAAVVAGQQPIDERRTSALHALLDPVTRRPAPAPQQTTTPVARRGAW